VLITLFGLLDLAGKSRRVPILGDMLHGCGSMIVALGLATTVVGFLLGTVFGINIVEAGWIPETTALGRFMAWLQGDVPGTKYSIQMAGAICIGVFHICLAMTIKALLYTKKEGFRSQISTWGWLLLIVGTISSSLLLMAGVLTQEQFRLALIAIGAVAALAIYLLNNVGRLAGSPLKGLLINPLAGLYDTYNMASGLLGDVLSYIRIYALCLAGGMLGGAFNMIGDMVWNGGGAGVVFAVLIYIVGHLFNLLMSAISAFVHPLRLNFVEYFKNSGYEGKGTGYKPFRLVE
jgi:V/A-type H+-transporting ATPase subunit I